MLFQSHKNQIKIFLTIISTLFIFGGGRVGLLAQTLTRGPYLQQLSQNGVIIRWRTDIPTNSIINFSKQDSAKVFTVKDNVLTQEHIVQLTDLQPDTKYTYSISADSKTLASGKDFYFITAPSSIENRPINIWAMGDFGDNSKPVYIQNQKDVRTQYLKNKANYTDLWLWLGDNAYCCGTDIEYQKQIFDFYGSNILGNTAFFPVPGNHEYLETPTAQVDKKINYFNIINVPTKAEMGGIASNTKEYYAYNYGNIHFVALDSYGLEDGKLRLSDQKSKQFQWLVNDLAANKSLWTVVYLHHPPYTKRSHDSNAEPELVAIRENLVPVFDKYKVDLVLSGHSHIYERSYLMAGHTGHSETFNIPIHVVQNVNGKYEKDPDSRPIINKDEGTIYCVVGSAGRIDWNGDPDPQPSSIYSNVIIGGSMLLTIDNNRLDARWVCADGIIRDNFTVFKNVNKTEKKTIEYGEKIRLTASWNGSHEWSNGVKKQGFIEIAPRKDTIISVVDSLGFLNDIFEIKVQPQPIITANLKGISNICIKNELKVYFDVKNTTLDKWEYQLELSDENGTFNKPVQLYKSKISPFQIIIPDTLKESKNYRFRVRPDVDYFQEIPTGNLAINLPSTVSFLGDKTMPFDTTITLKLHFEGTSPYKYKVNSLPENTAQTKDISIQVKPLAASSYTIEKVSNICGVGSILSNNKITILAPLAIENEENQAIIIYPNPTLGEITIENHTNQLIKGQIALQDINGKKLLQKAISLNQIEKLSLSEFPAGSYILIIESNNLKVSKKIIKQ